MTLLEVLEAECNNLSVKTRFEYATLDEANAIIFDKLASGDFPVCLVLPFDTLDPSRANGVVNSTAEINAIFLSRITSAETIDTITKDIENNIISPMRTLTREWINRIDDNEIINEDGIMSATHKSTHEPLMDAHLFGNWAVFVVKFTEGLTVCTTD